MQCTVTRYGDAWSADPCCQQALHPHKTLAMCWDLFLAKDRKEAPAHCPTHRASVTVVDTLPRVANSLHHTQTSLLQPKHRHTRHNNQPSSGSAFQPVGCMQATMPGQKATHSMHLLPGQYFHVTVIHVCRVLLCMRFENGDMHTALCVWQPIVTFCSDTQAAHAKASSITQVHTGHQATSEAPI